MSTTLTAAFLFVDVVGSTDILHRLGDDANDELRERYTPVLRDALTRHGGTEVKSLGDGLMAAFPGSVASAVAAAIAMQQGVDRLFSADPLLRIQLRIGISAGEAVFHEQDWSGVPVVEAARLESAARPGTILANDLVRGIVGARGGFEFVPVGERQLKGFPEPMRCVEVVWEAAQLLPEVPLASELTNVGGTPLIGRVRELDQLLECWKEVSASGSPQWVSVVGEAGAGTSRLAAELASVARADRAVVLFGRCEESPPLPVQPWAQALRWWTASVPADVLRELVGPYVDDLVAVVPSLSVRVPELLGTRRAPEAALVDAAASALAAIARADPLLVVVDQIQLADTATLEVLHRLVEAEDASLLIVTLERVDEPDDEPVVAAPTLVELRPLDLAAVQELMDAVIGRREGSVPPSREFAARVQRETRGSPRSIVEVVERLRSSGALELSGREQDEAVRSAFVAVSPYKGLLPFGEDDAELYFGRNEEVAALLGRLGSSRFVAVTGPSGSGKSSLVRAGLVPALARGALAGSEAWRTMIFTPGTRPLTELAWALANVTGGRISDVLGALERGPGGVATVLDELGRHDPEARVLLVVDQFEELFTLSSDEVERQHFVDAILHAAAPGGRIMVVAVIRADFFGHATAVPGLAGAFEVATFVVGPMDADGIRSVIEGPAEAAGLRLERGLADLMVRDVASEPGSLPLLSHALYETWKRRESGLMTVAAYRDAGGVRGAVARTAEGVFTTRLEPGLQLLARELFVRLTELGEGTEDTRRRASRDELEALAAHPDDLRRLLDELVQSRLVTVSADTVDVAHEALIREWPRLRSWLDEDRSRLRSLRHLTHAAAEWDDGGRDPADLYGESRLASADAAVDVHRVTSLEREFLEASRHMIERRERRERAHQRRLRRMLTVACVLLVGVVVASAIAFRQRNIAHDQVDEARARQADADFRRLLSDSQSLISVDRSVAHLLALAASNERDSPQSRSALLSALQADRYLLGQVPLARGPSGSTLVGDDLLVYGSQDGRVYAVNLGSENPTSFAIPLGEDAAGPSAPVHVTDDPSRTAGGAVAVARSDDGQIWRLDAEAKTASGPPIEAGQPILALAASERLDLVAAALADSSVGIWRLSTGDPVGVVPGTVAAPADPAAGDPTTSATIDADDVAALAFSPVAPELVVQRPGGWLQRIDTVGIAPLSAPFGGVPPPSTPEAGHLAFSPDGTLVVSYDPTLPAEQRAVDLATESVLWAAPNHRRQVAFESDARLVTVTERGELVVMRPRTGEHLRAVADTQFGSSAVDVLLSPDDSSATVVSQRGSLAARWSLTGDGPLTTASGAGPATPLEMSPSRTRVLARHGGIGTGTGGGSGGSLAVWEAPSGKLVEGDLPLLSATFAGSDDRLFGVFPDGTAGFYDLQRHERSAPLPIATAGLAAVAVSSEGTVVIGRDDGSVELHDGRVGSAAPPLRVPSRVTGLQFSPDGSRLLVSEEGVASVYDWSDRRLVGPRIDGVRSASFTPDSRSLVVAASPTGIRLVNPVTGNFSATPFEGRNAEVDSVEVSPDGQLLRVTSRGDELQLYDVETGDELGSRLRTVQRADAHFTDDGTHLVTAGAQGLEFWDLRPSVWREAACRLAGRNLTVTEWISYLDHEGRRRDICERW